MGFSRVKNDLFHWLDMDSDGFVTKDEVCEKCVMCNCSILKGLQCIPDFFKGTEQIFREKCQLALYLCFPIFLGFMFDVLILTQGFTVYETIITDGNKGKFVCNGMMIVCVCARVCVRARASVCTSERQPKVITSLSLRIQAMKMTFYLL
jgi:hypothetical protein